MLGSAHLTTETANMGFRELAIRATIARAQFAHRLASTTNLSTLDEPTKAAWADCLELYEDTIANLNRSLSTDCLHDDSQTWLSAAIANQQTCRNGFVELNSSFHFAYTPFLSHNISNAVSNLFAINKAFCRLLPAWLQATLPSDLISRSGFRWGPKVPAVVSGEG
ncbi:hypothetical protein HPP92_023211 [Vanilla planifolia]|uniref:Pectinesterase inhibitor domain-containing protein n=1 Tax=Vanilla planifolia TaxID=51239 RepID=A0A835PZU5_VANPL|nr:hypothetical protein HPP92_023211 [Vanilla planifolia]